jgi:hypothetical protein
MSLWFVVCLFDHVSYHDWWHNHSFIVSLSVPDPTNLYLVLLVLAWVPPSPIHLNILPSCFSSLVASCCQVIQWLDLLWTFLLLASPPRGDGLQRIGSTPKCIVKRSLTTSVKTLWLLQLVKGANNAEGKGSHCTPKNKKAQRWDTGCSLVFSQFQHLTNQMQWYILYALPLSSIVTCHGPLLTVFIPYSTSGCILERGWHILWFAQTSCDWMG